MLVYRMASAAFASCPDLSGMAESSRRHVYSEHGCVTLDAVNTGVQNQYHTTLPCFQITNMEETNDLENIVPLEQKHYCKPLPSSVISKAQHRAWNLRLTDGKPSLKIGRARGEPRPSKQSRSCPWPGYKLHPRPSVGNNLRKNWRAEQREATS